MKNYLISDWLSPDEKYVIFMDELYDIEKKQKIGHVLEDFNNFVFFLRHSYSVSDLPKEIVTECMTELNNLLITENTKNIKNILLMEFEFDPIGWIKKKGSEAVSGIGEFINTAAKGMGDFVKNISKGEFAQAFSIIGKGALYVARKLRSAMYHPVGLIVDAILVATGIGKAVQWIPWAIIVALDILELTGLVEKEEELPFWMRILFLGIDVIGLVTTGAAAKAAKGPIELLLKGAKTEADIAKNLAKNPTAKSLMQKMVSGIKEIPKYLGKAIDWLSKKFPKGAELLKKAYNAFNSVVTKITNSFDKMLGKQQGFTKLATKTGAKEGGKTAGIVYGVEKGVEAYAERQAKNTEKDLYQKIKSSDVMDYM